MTESSYHSLSFDPGRCDGCMACMRVRPTHAIRIRRNVAVMLEDRCIDCGECLKVCPTAGLQPSLLSAGWEGLWTPVLVPRLGYCDYSCNACGDVCPTGAIPLLLLEKKRETVIGLAYIDQNRCIPWADARDCVVCEEMCPVPDKAIILEDQTVTNHRGETVTVRRPQVEREKCIGCGICETKCPLNGQAAIRIYVPNEGDSTFFSG